ncbi:MAG: zf-HC2 domain-containing protein [Fischerella sp.]|nr:zf-HC2 domain-containing protein [Fischerella sp.]
MTTDSHFNDGSHLQFHPDWSDENVKYTNESTGAMDMVKRDRFELLSAYLDGEVTAAERRQVEEWLANDPAVQSLYERLLKLRRGLRTMPVPQSQPVEQTVQQVMTRLRRRSRLALVWGGTAIAATIIGAVSGLVPSGEYATQQVTKRPPAEQAQPTTSQPISVPSLMVAINNPIIPIPKAAETYPEEEPVNQRKQLQPSDIENEYH